jgi:uroporphyrinogen decarboxylase
MNDRERWIETLTFGSPDRIPLSPGGPRESTLKRWHEEGLPEGADYFKYLCEILGIDMDWPEQPGVSLGVEFKMMPQFEEKILSHKADHYIAQDWKGNICEISDEYDVSYLREAKDFVTRKWIKCPVENRTDWEDMKKRYRVDSPGRLPEDFEERCSTLNERDYFFMISFPGPFWQMREWCGFEGLCMMMVNQRDFVQEMSEFWKNFVSGMLDRIFEHFVPDALRFNEDMAYKQKAMISPAMTCQFCKPCWEEWTGKAKDAGVPVVGVDSDGYIGELIPIWIESGMNYCDPIEVAAGNDLNEYKKRFGTKMAYRGGVDKRCMAKGGQVIRKELKRLEPVVMDGGYVPSCDHGVPSDISWPNFIEYTRLLAKMTGW